MFACGLIGLPSFGPRPQRLDRFPCESCACGCATAEYCWDKCCCHTDREKLRWASDHGITPPTFLTDRVGKHANVVVAIAATATNDGTVTRACCDAASNTACSESVVAAKSIADERQTSDPASVRVVRWVDAAKCHGIKLIWTIFSSVVVDRPSDWIAPLDPPFLFSQHPSDVRLDSAISIPDAPVPWDVAA